MPKSKSQFRADEMSKWHKQKIVAFHPSPEVAERAYELIHADRDGELTDEERKELESYLVIEHLMELIKLEAHRQLRQQAS